MTATVDETYDDGGWKPMTPEAEMMFTAREYYELLREIADEIEVNPDLVKGRNVAETCVAALEIIDARHAAEGEAAYNAWLDEIGEADDDEPGDDEPGDG